MMHSDTQKKYPGTTELKNLTENKTLVKKTCERIVKSDLPESKEEPKF